MTMSKDRKTDSQNKVGGTRLDKFLAQIAGEDVGELTPKTETEKRLNEIAEMRSLDAISFSSDASGRSYAYTVNDPDTIIH